jgi:hypothetical protein
MNIKTKYLCLLAVLSVVDVVIPIPILGFILIYIVLERPLWFKNAVGETLRILQKPLNRFLHGQLPG